MTFLKHINHQYSDNNYQLLKRMFSAFISVLIFALSFNVTSAYASDWINPAGGLYSDPSNWSTGVPLPSSSGAVFNLSSLGYTVNFSQNEQTEVLQVINDSVTFDLGGNIYLLNTSSSASTVIVGYIDTIASLTIENGGLGTFASSTLDISGVRVADFSGSVGTLTIDGSGGFPGVNGWFHQGDFTIGGGANSNGTFNVINGAQVETSGGRVWVGKPNNTSNSTILIDNASWTHTDGTTGGFSTDSTNASITIQNGGILSTQETILGRGLPFDATSATATVLVEGIGSTWQAGTMNMGTGTLTVNGGGSVTSTGDMYIGDYLWRYSNFTVTVDGVGSSMHVGGNLTLGGMNLDPVQGHLTVSNGANVTVSGHTSIDGGNNPGGSDVIVTGVNSQLRVTGQLNISNGASLNAESNGRILAGTINVGSFSGSNAKLNLSNGGRLSATSINNYSGLVDLQGGRVFGNVQNFNELNASGPVTNTINGDVTNNGTIKTTDTILEIAGTLTNNGAYISDPSDNIFGNLIVSTEGYLVGGAGDQFIINGDFTNNSTQNTLWDTNLAKLVFDISGIHNLTLASDDLGSIGIEDNFNWGTLRLESGAGLNLFDDDGDGAALYIGLLVLADGIDQLSLITSSYNIYYDDTLAGNSYLNGQSISLAGGAMLTPGTFSSVVPIPPAVWLFSSGLIGLIGLAIRKART